MHFHEHLLFTESSHYVWPFPDSHKHTTDCIELFASCLPGSSAQSWETVINLARGIKCQSPIMQSAIASLFKRQRWVTRSLQKLTFGSHLGTDNSQVDSAHQDCKTQLKKKKKKTRTAQQRVYIFCINVYLAVLNKLTGCSLFEPNQRSLPLLYKSIIRSLVEAI